MWPGLILVTASREDSGKELIKRRDERLQRQPKVPVQEAEPEVEVEGRGEEQVLYLLQFVPLYMPYPR